LRSPVSDTDFEKNEKVQKAVFLQDSLPLLFVFVCTIRSGSPTITTTATTASTAAATAMAAPLLRTLLGIGTTHAGLASLFGAHDISDGTADNQNEDNRNNDIDQLTSLL
jgi:hypothetical protein